MRKYEQLMLRLRERLSDPSSTGRLPNLSQLGKEEGYSLNTVHHAIQELKKEGLIVARPGRGTFLAQTAPFSSEPAVTHPTNSKEALPLQVIGFVSGIQNLIADPIGGAMFSGFERIFEREGRGRAIQFHSGMLKQRLVPVTMRNSADRICGTVCVAPFSGRYLNALSAQCRRIVSVDFNATPFGIDSIVADNIAGGLLATKYLLDLGHREIAYLGSRQIEAVEGTDDPAVGERFRGFTLAHLACNLTPNPALCHPISLGNVDAGIREFLHRDIAYTAVVCYDHNVAQRLETALKHNRVRIPADCSIVHAGGIDEEKAEINGVFFDFGDIAEQCWKLLTKMPTGNSATCELVVLPARLVVKNSAAPLHARKRGAKGIAR